MSENEDTAYQNLQDAAKAVLRGKFIPVNDIFLKKDLKSIIHISRHH